MSYTKNWSFFSWSSNKITHFQYFFKEYQCLSTHCFVSRWNMSPGNEINLKWFYEMASRTTMFWRNCCIGGIFYLAGENANLTTEVECFTNLWDPQGMVMQTGLEIFRMHLWQFTLEISARLGDESDFMHLLLDHLYKRSCFIVGSKYKGDQV